MSVPPHFESRVEIIARASSSVLETVRQHAMLSMHPLPEDSLEYQNWSNFVAEIEAEQHRRANTIG